MNMNHLMEIIKKKKKNREDKQNVIGALRKRRNISYWCVRSRVSPRDRQITARRKDTHTDKETKSKRVTDASRPTDMGEALCL